MAYNPNFNDSRVLSTTKRAITFVEFYTRSDKATWISRNQLYKHLGNTSKPLGKWLLDHLLIVQDSYYNFATGQCKTYRKNTKGVRQVKELAGLVKFKPQLTSEMLAEVESGDFTYTEKSNRYFNPVQAIPRVLRNSILANHGYRHHYDIEAAAANLLLQRAKLLNPNLTVSNLEHYTKNRSQVRQQIAKECEITEKQAKTLLNSMLQGGVISTWSHNKTFVDLNYNYDAVIKLNHNDLVRALKKDIKSMWDSLRSQFPVRYMTDVNGKQRRQRISGTLKSGFYREQEKEVADVIRRYLKKNSVRYLWIHDGWCCDQAVDPNEIASEVRRKTNFVIELEWTIYEDE